MSDKVIEEFDERGNLIYKYFYGEDIEEHYEYNEDNKKIHCMSSDGWQCWWEYDKKNNVIYNRSSTGYNCWYEYDENNRISMYKSTGIEYRYKENKIIYSKYKDEEYWYKYDEDNNRIDITKQVKRRKEKQELYFNNKKVNRFSLMDI